MQEVLVVTGRPRSRRSARCGIGTFASAALLVAVALVVAAWIPAAQAIPFRVSGGAIDTSVVVGNAVDNVLLENVSIKNGVSVVFNVAAMLPGTLHIDLKDCVCGGGSQIYVLGHRGEPLADQSLEVSVIGLDGSFCSLVLAYNLPAHTNVTIENSTIVMTGQVNYRGIGGLTDVVASPLVLYNSVLSKSHLRVNNSVLQTLPEGGMAMYVGGGVHLISSAVVLHNVSLDASGGAGAYAMYVPQLSTLTLEEKSIFSVTSVSVVSSGSGFFLGGGVTLLNSVLRLVGIVGHVAASPVVVASGGAVGPDGWLNLHDVWVGSGTTSVASLSSLTLGGGVVSISRCVVSGATLASGPTIASGVVSVQCNRAGGKVLRNSGDYIDAGLSSVSLVPCEGCVEEQSCFAALTALFSDCACHCAPHGIGEACLPFDVPLGKITGGGGVEECTSGVTLEESVTVGARRGTVCFDAVVFSGPIVVTMELQLMDPFVDALNVTLRNCSLEKGAILRVKGIDEMLARTLPSLYLTMTNITSTEGTIVLQDALPPGSYVLLENSSLRATVGESLYVPTSSGEQGNRYGPVLVLDGVRLQSTQFVMTRTSLVCNGDTCTPILVEHSLWVSQSSTFYMDNCIVNAVAYVINFIVSDLTITTGSVFSVQNSSWVAMSTRFNAVAWWCNDVVVRGGSVLQFVTSRFYLSRSMMSIRTLTVEDSSWLVHRDSVFGAYQVLYIRSSSGAVKFLSQSAWSILDNKFVLGAVMSRSMMTNYWYSPVVSSSAVHGRCNELMGSPVTFRKYIM